MKGLTGTTGVSPVANVNGQDARSPSLRTAHDALRAKLLPQISVLGLPLSVVPAANWRLLPDGRESLFWHRLTSSNSLLLTWQNALVNRDTNLPVTAQAELFPNGAAAIRYGFSGLADASILSNAATRVWRDGVEETVPLQTGTVAEMAFPAPPVTGTNTLDEVYARIAGGFFRVKRIDGRWWMVDPLGNRYISKGVAAFDPGKASRQKAALRERFGSMERWAADETTRTSGS